jgi:hypothetical protein
MNQIFNQLHDFFFNSIKGLIVLQIIGLFVIIKVVKKINLIGKAPNSVYKQTLIKPLSRSDLIFLINDERKRNEKELLTNSWSLTQLAKKRAKLISESQKFHKMVTAKPKILNKLEINTLLSKRYTVENLSEIIFYSQHFDTISNKKVLNTLMTNPNYKDALLSNKYIVYGISFYKNTISLILSS